MERHWEAAPHFLSDPYGELDVDTYKNLLTDVLRPCSRSQWHGQQHFLA